MTSWHAYMLCCQWHSRGQGFDPPRLHHPSLLLPEIPDALFGKVWQSGAARSTLIVASACLDPASPWPSWPVQRKRTGANTDRTVTLICAS